MTAGSSCVEGASILAKLQRARSVRAVWRASFGMSEAESDSVGGGCEGFVSKPQQQASCA